MFHKSPRFVYSLLMLFILRQTISTQDIFPCTRRVYLARAEQADENGLRCWGNIKVPSCGGRCDSREVFTNWEFPFKKSHHPVCVYGTRRPLTVRLPHCDPGTTPGTDLFHFIAAENCRCKICSSQHTSCEWLPPNATILEGVADDYEYSEDNEN